VLFRGVAKFNSTQFSDEYLDNEPAAPIAELDELVGDDSDGNSA
jgi:hypothetical protein